MKLSDVIRRGTNLARPEASSVAIGTLYYDTDNSSFARSNGTSWESVEGGGVSDHGALTGLADDDHSTLYPLITNFEADRATIGTNWTDLTDGGATTLHSHLAASEATDVAHTEATLATHAFDIPGVGEGQIVVNIDGGGSAITTGIKGDLYIPFSIQLIWVTMLADQSGSIVVDVWSDSYDNFPPTDADSITASDPPTISTATKSQDTNLSTWTVAVPGGNTLRFNVDSVTTITRLAMTFGFIRTDIQP